MTARMQARLVIDNASVLQLAALNAGVRNDSAENLAGGWRRALDAATVKGVDRIGRRLHGNRVGIGD